MKPPQASKRCSVHRTTPAESLCALCARGMCAPCARFFVGGRPSCTLCAYEVVTRRQRRLSLAIVFAFMTVAATAVVATGSSNLTVLLGVVVAGLAGLFCAAAILPRRHEPELEVVPREPGDRPASSLGGVHRRPIRTAARRVMTLVAPPISARHTVLALLLAAAFVLTATPALLSLPRFVEIEIALGLLLVILAVAFSALLYGGYRLDEDHVLVAPGAPWTVASREKTLSEAGELVPRGCGDVIDCGEGVLESFAVIAVAIAWLLVLGTLAALAWLFVELLLPLAFIAVYELLVFGLRRVANDRHGCEARLAPSIGWGSFWSFVYVLPIGVVVGGLHLVHALIVR